MKEDFASYDPNDVIGFVTNCHTLNVRVEPTINSDVICTLPVDYMLMIDLSKSTDNWYYIYTAIGVEGYCAKKYVTIN